MQVSLGTCLCRRLRKTLSRAPGGLSLNLGSEETIELVTIWVTYALSGAFTTSKRDVVTFMISEGNWQLVCKPLQMHNPLNFWFRFISAWVWAVLLALAISRHSSGCLSPPNAGKCIQRIEPYEDPSHRPSTFDYGHTPNFWWGLINIRWDGGTGTCTTCLNVRR